MLNLLPIIWALRCTVTRGCSWARPMREKKQKKEISTFTLLKVFDVQIQSNGAWSYSPYWTNKSFWDPWSKRNVFDVGEISWTMVDYKITMVYFENISFSWWTKYFIRKCAAYYPIRTS